MFQKLLLISVFDKPWPAKVGVAIFGVGLAIGLRGITNIIAPGVSPYAFTYPASLLATLLAGWEAGAIALFFTIVLGWYFVVPQAAALGGAMNYRFAAVIIACFVGITIIAVAQAFRLAARLALTERGEKLAERELLFKELQHRVGNDFTVVMSLLDLQRRRSRSEETQEALAQAVSRIHSISGIHRQLYAVQSATTVDLRQYLNELAAKLRQGMLTGNIELRCHCDPVLMMRDKALTLGLLMNELVTNCVKHAFPDDRNGEIEVSFRRKGDGWRFVVQDNGCGKARDDNGLGTGLIAQFARQAEGEITFEMVGGTRAIVDLPQSIAHLAADKSEGTKC